jgi:hypothetical protein
MDKKELRKTCYKKIKYKGGSTNKKGYMSSIYRRGKKKCMDSFNKSFIKSFIKSAQSRV